MEAVAGLKVLVTGDTGFIGSWMCQSLVQMGARVVGIGLKPATGRGRPHTEPSLFRELHLRKRIKHYTLDILNKKKLEEVVRSEKPDLVIHLAAQALVRRSYEEPMETFRVNMVGTINVLEACKVSGVRAVVVATTDKVYLSGEAKPFKEGDALGGGKDAYSLSKAGADWLAQTYVGGEMKVGIARAGNVIGGGDWSKDRLLPDLVRSMDGGKGLVIRYPKAVRVFQHVLEMVSGYLSLGVKLVKGEAVEGAYNFGPKPNGQVEVQEFINLVEKLSGRQVKVKVKREQEKPEEKYVGLVTSKAKDKLGWEAKLRFKKAMRMSLEWYKRFYNGESAEKLCNEQIKEYFLV